MTRASRSSVSPPQRILQPLLGVEKPSCPDTADPPHPPFLDQLFLLGNARSFRAVHLLNKRPIYLIFFTKYTSYTSAIIERRVRVRACARAEAIIYIRFIMQHVYDVYFYCKIDDISFWCPSRADGREAPLGNRSKRSNGHGIVQWPRTRSLQISTPIYIRVLL